MTSSELTEVPDFGPAMLKLTVKQRGFVIAMIETGSSNYTRAAAMAGYAGDRETLKVTGHKLAHDRRILDAMHEEAIRRMEAGKLVAVTKLLHIAENTNDEKVQLKAIAMVLNRTGLHEMSEHRVITKDESKTDEAMIERIKQLAPKLGIDPQKLLGTRAKPALAPEPIDAEFVEVGSTEGLEDLL